MAVVLQIIASILPIAVCITYLRQVNRGESTPNPSTWVIWFIVTGINTVTYFQVVNSNYFKTAIVFMVFLSMGITMAYSFFKGKFAKLAKIDISILILSIVIGIFWLITKNANISSLLLQIIIFSSYFPTAIGLMQNRLKEKHLPWTLIVIAYILQTISLLINFDGNLYQLFLPIINGIMGNGLILGIILYKKIKKPFISTVLF
jgi:hypothetical protein